MSRTAAELPTPTDVSRLLGLHTEGAHLIMALIIVSNAVFVFATAEALDHPWGAYTAAVLVSAGVVILGRPYPDPFPLPLTLAILGIVTVSTVLVSYALPDDYSVVRAVARAGPFGVVDAGAIDWASGGVFALQDPLFAIADSEYVRSAVPGAVDQSNVREAEVPQSAFGGVAESARPALEQRLG